MTTVTIERRGKKPQKYTLLQRIMLNDYFAVLENGGDRPKKVYMISLTNEEVNESMVQNPRNIKR